MSEFSTEILHLVNGCKAGRTDAQQALVRRFAAPLMGVARRYSRNSSEAEDILQDAFILIFKKIEQFNPQKGTLHGWMRRIVVHTALAEYRKFRYQFENLSDEPPETADPEPDIFSRLHFETLLGLIDALPPVQRAVFNLAVFDEFSHEEIAEALGIPEGTSRSMLSRARRHLQEQIIKLQTHELAGI